MARRKAAAPEAAPPAAPPEETITEQVRRQLDAILFGYVEGLSLATIGAKLSGRTLTGLQLRTAIANDSGLSKKWAEIRAARAEVFVERAAEEAARCDPKDAAALYLKLAEKLAPETYGKTVKHTGPGGGPLKVEVEAMSPADAYRAMLDGES